MAASRYAPIWSLMSRYKFVVCPKSTNGDLICAICKDLIIDATVNSSCGCHYCHNCINQYIISGGQYCPCDKEDCKEHRVEFGTNIVRSEVLNRKISKLRVDCPNRRCDCNIQLVEMEAHLKFCTKEQILNSRVSIGFDIRRMDKEIQTTDLSDNTFTPAELLIEVIQNLKSELKELKVDFEKSKVDILRLKEESVKKDIRIAMLEKEMREKIFINTESIINKEFYEHTTSKEVSRIEGDNINDEFAKSKIEMMCLKEDWKEELNKHKRQLENADNDRAKMKKDLENSRIKIGLIEEILLTKSNLILALEEQLKEFKNQLQTEAEKENESTCKQLKDQWQRIEEDKIERKNLATLLSDVIKEINKLMVGEVTDKWKEELDEQRRQLENADNDRKHMRKDLEKTQTEIVLIEETLTTKLNIFVSLEEQLEQFKNQLQIKAEKDNEMAYKKVNEQWQRIEEAKIERKTMVTMLSDVMKEISKMVGGEISDRVRSRQIDNLIKLCPILNSDFIWRVNHCSKRINTEIFSESFYSNNNKLCLSIFIDVVADSIWLYCYVMKGVNDDKIEWPIRRVVTLGIIDQGCFRIYKSQIYQSSLRRPNMDRDDYVGSSLIKYSLIKDKCVNDSIIVSCVISHQ